MLSLFIEIKEGAFIEIEAFSRKKPEENQKNISESFYVLSSMSKILECLLESPVYEKNYGLIDEIVLILEEMILFIEKKNLIENIQIMLNPIIMHFFLMVMKWEDYLKNSWNKLKVFLMNF